MDSSSEMIALPRPPSKKWVKFDDLENVERRTEDSARRHSAASSGGSFDLTDGRSSCASTTATVTSASPVDFSQSLGTGETAMATAAAHKFFGSPDAASNTSGSDPSMDKYTAAFSGAQGKPYKGWSTKVLHGTNNKFGWSEELLGYGSSCSDAAEEMSSGGEDCDGCNGGISSNAEGTASSASAKSWAGRKPWNASPKRTFVRNFP